MDRGDQVCITGRNAEPLAEAVAELGEGQAIYVAGKAHDAAHQDEVIATDAWRPSGGIDYLVNNVGTNPVFGPMLDLDLAVVRKILDINVRVRVRVDAEGRTGPGWPSTAARSSTSPRSAALRPAPGHRHLRHEQGGPDLPHRAARGRARPEDPGQRGRPGRGQDAVRQGPVRGARGGGRRAATRPGASACRRTSAPRSRSCSPTQASWITGQTWSSTAAPPSRRRRLTLPA